MKKIFVDKNDGVAEVVERIIGDEAGEIVLVIPKGAGIGDSPANFSLIKREADSAGKNVLVESVDENILDLAKKSGIEATHSFFEKRNSSAFSDIVPVSPIENAEKVSGKRGRKKVSENKIVESKESVTLHVVSEEEEKREEPVLNVSARERKRQSPKKLFPGKRYFVGGIIVLAMIFAVWFGGGIFGRATITIDFNKIPWSLNESFLADTSVSKVNFDKNIIPGEIFSSERNLTQLFPASETRGVSAKAKGKITIYNAFGPKPQSLIATTRFETADGKIFRIINQVRVPGAKIKNGNIVPSSIDADIVADKPGDAYNIGPVAKLLIPGFKNSPRYNGFYGEIKNATAGGFTGKRRVPTPDDIKKAKDRVSGILTTSLENNLTNSYPGDFLILKDAKKISITKLMVNENTDDKGNFSVFGEAKMRAFGFRESDLKNLLLVKATKDTPDHVFRELNINYAGLIPDFAKGKLSFAVSSQGSLSPSFSAESFKGKVSGKNANDARSAVSELKEFSGAKISLWPMWLNVLPNDPKKISIVVN